MEALAMCVRQQSVNTSPKNIAREDNPNTLTELSFFSHVLYYWVQNMQSDLVTALVVNLTVTLSEQLGMPL